jgi:endonuclease/exonuclease/phosphatase family metal-dependent hydrolase
MSNNLWWCDINSDAWKAMGEDCSFTARAPGFARIYAEVKPDIIGLQECSARMGHELMALLTAQKAPYAFLWGRDTPIMYHRDKFELIDSDVCIYPEEVPGLEGSFNNLRTKSYCIAVLRLKETGQLLIFATTHLWYKSGDPKAPNYYPGSEEARAWQVNLLIDRVEQLQAHYNCPAVIVGDFNTWEGGAAARAAKERGYLYARDIATDHADDTTGMHYCCGEGYKTELHQGNWSLDHIFVRGFTENAVKRFDRCCPDYYYPLSDHSPVWIDVHI